MDAPDRVEAGRGQPRGLGGSGCVTTLVDTTGGGRDPLSSRGEDTSEPLVGRVDPAAEITEDILQPLGGLCDRVRVGHGDARAPEPRREVAETAGRDLAAERTRRGVGERVRLIDDDDLMVGQQDPSRREVSQVESVVDDEDVGAVGPATGMLGEAVLTGGTTGRARALVRPARHRPPNPRRDVGVGGVAGLGVRGEAFEPDELGAEVGAGPLVEQGLAADRGAQPRQAQVLGASLQHRGFEGDAALVGHEGQILAPQLVLEREGRSRHHRRPSRRDGRGQVGEALARTGRGLGDEVMRIVEGGGDGFGEEPLTGAVVAAEAPHALVEDGERPGFRHTSETTGRRAL